MIFQLLLFIRCIMCRIFRAWLLLNLFPGKQQVLQVFQTERVQIQECKIYWNNRAVINILEFFLGLKESEIAKMDKWHF